MKFEGKYDTIIENTITRFEQGGVLSGDLVRFRKDAMKNEKIKGMMENYKAMIEDAMGTDLNLRVSAIKSIRPTTTGNYGGGSNSGTRAPTDYFVDIVVEYAPGLWRNPITVPIEVLEVVDTNGNLAPVPDSLKRKNKVEMPKDVESPDADRKTPETNTKPQFPNKTTDGRTQIKKPEEVKKKNQGKLTLEDVFDNMVGAEPGAEPGVEPGTIDGDDSREFTINFSEDYGKNPADVDTILQKINPDGDNMETPAWNGNSVTVRLKGFDTDKLSQALNGRLKGKIDVVEGGAGMTEFEPTSVEAGSSSPTLPNFGATA